MRIQLEQTVLLDRLNDNTDNFSKTVEKNFSITQRITVSNQNLWKLSSSIAMKSNVGTHRKKRKDMKPVLLVERRKIIYLNPTTILNYMLLQTPLLCNK